MKKLYALAIVQLFLFSPQLFAQQTFKAALDDFHYVLAFTYHPMEDEGNFDPIRKRSAELVAKGDSIERALDRWEKKSQRTEQALEQLVEQCKALHEVIGKSASDDVVRTRLSAIHTKFHEIETLFAEEK